MIEWKKKKKLEKQKDAELALVKEEADAWQMRQKILCQDVAVMNIPFEALTPLMDNGFHIIGEVATKSEVELLRCEGVTKETVDFIRGYLESFGLGFSLNLADYDVSVIVSEEAKAKRKKSIETKGFIKKVLPLPLEKALGTVRAGVSIYREDTLEFTKVNDKFVWLAPAGKVSKVGFTVEDTKKD